MQRRLIAVLSLVALLLPGVALAAGKPKEEKTKGNVVSVGKDKISVQTKKGPVTVLLTQKSRIVMGKMELPLAALKEGARVTVVGVAQPSGEIVAREIQLPAPAAPMQSTMPSGSGGHSH